MALIVCVGSHMCIPTGTQTVVQVSPAPPAAKMSTSGPPKPSPLSSVTADFTSYLAEFLFWRTPPPSPFTQDQSTILDDAINATDVVVLAKVGCGFCKRAKESLATQAQTTPFTMKVIDVVGGDYTANESDELKALIMRKLGLWDMTFPQIVVKGQYVGGADDTIELIGE